MMNLKEQLRERLSILLDMGPELIEDDSSFNDLGVDSLMRLELVSLVEQYIGIELPEQDVDKMWTLNQISFYVSGLQSQTPN